MSKHEGSAMGLLTLLQLCRSLSPAPRRALFVGHAARPSAALGVGFGLHWAMGSGKRRLVP